MFAFSWLRHWENIRSYLCYLLSDYQHRAGKLASLLVGCWWGSKYDPPVVIKTTAYNTKRQAGNINSQVRKKKPTDSVGHRCTGLAPRCSLNGGEGSGGGLGCHATLKKKKCDSKDGNVSVQLFALDSQKTVLNKRVWATVNKTWS